jgi:transcriptional regulator with XRE-family HTH domain
MVDTSKILDRSKRRRFYFNRRFQNRVFAKLISFIAEEGERAGVTKKDIANRLEKDPAQITRWLSSPSNLTLDTISDLLFALDAEPQPFEIRLFSEMPAPNFAHSLIRTLTHNEGNRGQVYRLKTQAGFSTTSSATSGFTEARMAGRRT